MERWVKVIALNKSTSIPTLGDKNKSKLHKIYVLFDGKGPTTLQKSIRDEFSSSNG